MKFANAQWLWALLVLPIFYLIAFWSLKRRKRDFGKFAHEKVWSAIVPELDWNAGFRKSRYWLIALMFAILSLARPQWGTHEETVKVTGLDLMIAFDISNSMEVEDITPSRIKKAKHLVRTILDRLQGDRVGLVGFAGSAYVACPLTTDFGYVSETLDILSPKSVTNQGTDIGIALETASRAVLRGAESGTSGKIGRAHV